MNFAKGLTEVINFENNCDFADYESSPADGAGNSMTLSNLSFEVCVVTIGKFLNMFSRFWSAVNFGFTFDYSFVSASDFFCCNSISII